MREREILHTSVWAGLYLALLISAIHFVYTNGHWHRYYKTYQQFVMAELTDALKIIIGLVVGIFIALKVMFWFMKKSRE